MQTQHEQNTNFSVSFGPTEPETLGALNSSRNEGLLTGGGGYCQPQQIGSFKCQLVPSVDTLSLIKHFVVQGEQASRSPLSETLGALNSSRNEGLLTGGGGYCQPQQIGSFKCQLVPSVDTLSLIKHFVVQGEQASRSPLSETLGALNSSRNEGLLTGGGGYCKPQQIGSFNCQLVSSVGTSAQAHPDTHCSRPAHMKQKQQTEETSSGLA